MTDTISEIHSNGKADGDATKARPVRAVQPKTEKDTQEVMTGVLNYLWNRGSAPYEELLPSADGDKRALRSALVKLDNIKRITIIDNDGRQEYKLRGLELGQRAITFVQCMKQVNDEASDLTVFKDWKTITFRIRITRPVLAGLPLGEDPSQLTFRRMPHDDDKGEDVWLSTDYFRAMWRAAADMTHGLSSEQKSVFRNDHVSYDDVLLDPSYLMVGWYKCVGAHVRTAGKASGTGFTYHEAIKIGTEIPTTLYYPSSVFDAKDREILRGILTIGGRYIGFSPAKHKLGLGRFAVLEEEDSARQTSLAEGNERQGTPW